MTPEDVWSQVTDLLAFERNVLASTKKATLFSMPVLIPVEEAKIIDWNEALFLASLVSVDSPEKAHDGALRIVQTCIQSPEATGEQKTAARFLLERLGNQRAVVLALSKNYLGSDNLISLSGPLELDLVRRRLSFTVYRENGGTIQVNEFQRQFWEAAKTFRWVSVSAPTSVGKSYIVKQWLLDRILSSTAFAVVYLVPTRALIEEVSKDLEELLVGNADVFTLPWDGRIGEHPKQVFVLTQERLHILQNKYPELVMDLIFVDEAQKFGDDARGILLQRVLDEATINNPNVQVLFASPLASNPELLIQGIDIPTIAITSEIVTVNQNLIHVNQRFRHPQIWEAEVVVAGETHQIGTFMLPARPSSPGKRLPLVAVALGKRHTSNVVYVNGPAEAEKVAGQIFEALGSDRDISNDPEILALSELIEKTIHSKYLLRQYLQRGVAFHYGNMPLLVREEVERLFRNGTLKYLVCTSTLLEGINLPCQNLFVRGPHKGKGRPMSAGDFWNLAGRAGRWGVEFQGNIVCIDTKHASTWESVPSTRVRQPITRSTDNLLLKFDELVAYIRDLSPLEMSRANPPLESLFSTLATHYRQHLDLRKLKWLVTTAAQNKELVEALKYAADQVTLSGALVRKHAGISPISMQRLADFFSQFDGPAIQLTLSVPESQDAVQSYTNAIGLVDKFLGGGFTNNPGRQYSLAILFVDWMQGKPLSLLISRRIRYQTGKGTADTLPNMIRSVMTDVEQFARFQAPLYLACYVDTLREVRPDLFNDDQDSGEVPDIAMMLELGVSRTTELSMMSLGASRTSAVALSDHIMDDNLEPEDCIRWIEGNDLESLGIPTLIRLELEKTVERYRARKRNIQS